MKNYNELIGNHVDFDINVLDILYLLFKSIPNDIYISSLDYNSNQRVLINGHGKTIENVITVVNRLKRSGMFAEIKLDYAKSGGENTESQTTFQISGTIKR